MKKKLASFAVLLFFCVCSFAQTSPEPPSAGKNQSIIIHKQNDAKEKLTIIIDGDKITINGKPMEDFKNDDIQITENNSSADIDMPPMPPRPPMPPHGGDKMFSGSFNGFQNKAFLGVASKSNNGGATVEMVSKGSPAEKAGLQKGDVITKVGTTEIDDADDLVEAIGKYKPADKVTLTYKRNGTDNKTTATLDKNKDQPFAWSNEFNNGGKMMNELLMNWNENKPGLGIRAQDMENGAGVKVLDLNDDDAPAAKAGLKGDDVITAINSKTIQTIKDIREAMKETKPGDEVKVTYLRGGASQTVSVHLPKPVETSDL